MKGVREDLQLLILLILEAVLEFSVDSQFSVFEGNIFECKNQRYKNEELFSQYKYLSVNKSVKMTDIFNTSIIHLSKRSDIRYYFIKM
ncbi:hypothetical protein I7I50_09641 [Histoplasma capsulatum G186AR]|uniref:Uncharacterized protein n=1 Tax=Ajellomyces capsulatus TaxID=5037 RepID=A0A8H7YSN2_AJECA|nr:hypothetical protein I7I52_07171 [Histoplasma capsulatum]QSS74454.1 hypothetical protein I7I50_09641 [Histoplasma capsulatum G186AR]